MPIYEYQCQACGHRLETMQRISDPPLSTCPECSGALKKLLSAPSFQFKGSGWYVTDYARSGDREKSEEKEGKKDGDTKGEKAEGDGKASKEKSEKASSGDSAATSSAKKGDGKGAS